jgi:hypothetical protein
VCVRVCARVCVFVCVFVCVCVRCVCACGCVRVGVPFSWIIPRPTISYTEFPFTPLKI